MPQIQGAMNQRLRQARWPRVYFLA